MANEPKITWVGKSGKEYTYWFYTIGTTFTAVPANYIFCKETTGDKVQAIYIGQTGNLSERFDNHHRMPCIKREGATHICTHKSSDSEPTRKAEEDDLIANYNPICNRQ
ncbi:hypothetical protein ES703_83069 [subsurface metagenome]